VTKIAGSGSISQRLGSPDLDPHQNTVSLNTASNQMLRKKEKWVILLNLEKDPYFLGIFSFIHFSLNRDLTGFLLKTE
jgi:hypothetical protein